MQISPDHISNWLRGKLPPEQKDASWGYLAEQFPWYPVIHLIRAYNHPEDVELLQKAAVYQNDLLRLHSFLNTPLQVQAIPENETLPIPVPGIVAEEALSEQEQTIVVELEPVALNEESEPVPEIPLMVAAEPVSEPTLEELIPITPYYTVDYFASQGIKIDKRILLEPETQLDQQVKSFTDWLKTMKRMKFQPQTTYTDPLVEVNAKASLNKKEIVTEAMAEVWAKQGNLQMAGQIYSKLMLLYPEKSPYFAARLQELKQIQ